MDLYHGSDRIVELPQYGIGALHNDYGRGFYCTENQELAKEWACARNKDGFANRYIFDTTNLRILNLNDEKYHILNWLALLTKNRSYWQKNSIAEEAKGYLQEHFLIDTSEFDVIVGYRADDSYFSFAQDFIMGFISLEKLSQAMHIGNLGEQVVLKSQTAFDRITYCGNEEALAEEYFIKKNAKDLEARNDYRERKQMKSRIDETYILDIMRKEMTGDEIRIRSGIFTASAKSAR